MNVSSKVHGEGGPYSFAKIRAIRVSPSRIRITHHSPTAVLRFLGDLLFKIRFQFSAFQFSALFEFVLIRAIRVSLPVRGLWSVVCGPWSVVRGPWSRGPRFPVSVFQHFSFQFLKGSVRA
jgi:hypothetical protein